MAEEKPPSDSELKSWLQQKGKQGMAEMGAYLRGGLIDLQNAISQPFPDSQQQASVLGMAGVPTPGEVDKAHEATGSDKDIKASVYGNLPAQQTPKGNENQHEQGRGGR